METNATTNQDQKAATVSAIQSLYHFSVAMIGEPSSHTAKREKAKLNLRRMVVSHYHTSTVLLLGLGTSRSLRRWRRRMVNNRRRDDLFRLFDFGFGDLHTS